MDRCLAIKREVSCWALWHKFSSCPYKEVWKRWRVWQTTRAAKSFALLRAGLHLAALRHVAEMFSLQVCSFPAGDILVCCRDLLLVQCSPQVLTKVCCRVVLHALSPSDADALKAIHHKCLPTQHLPQQPGNHSSHMPPPLLTSDHQKIVLSSTVFINTCKVVKYA